MQTPLSNPAINPSVLAEIREMAGDDAPILVSQILDCYLQESPTLIAAIREASSQQNTPEFTRSAHSLKSSSDALGIIGVTEICRNLELIGRSNLLHDRADEIAEALAQLEVEYVRVEAVLQQMRNEP